MAQRAYKQLTDRDRLMIAKLRNQKEKLSLSEIARRIGKDKSTISRELRRNALKVTPQDRFFYFRVDNLWTEEDLDEYLKTQPAECRQTFSVWCHRDAHVAAKLRADRASLKRCRKSPETRKWVIEKLRGGWSPQQIAGRSCIDGPQSVSYEYVYALIHRDKKRGGRLYRLLKRFRKRKQRVGPRVYPRACEAPERVSIEERPAIVDRRARLGDCEADLIVGYRQSGYVLSVIDRKSRAVVLRHLKSKDMTSVRLQLELALKKLGGAFTLTVDNGKEFYAHHQLTENAGVRVFFTHPYCSTERASIENLNGLVRHFLPKRTSFARLTQRRLDTIEGILNQRPRRCLGYLTPHEVHFKKKKLRTRTTVALDP